MTPSLITAAILGGWVAIIAMFTQAIREWRHTIHTEQHQHNPSPHRDIHGTKGDPS